MVLTQLIPGGVVWVAVDDTLCHNRDAEVAFGGIFLDAVLSSQEHKTFRFGLSWVVLGLAVRIPMRPDRYFCLPVLWRLYREQGHPEYQTRLQAAVALARRLAEANPTQTFWLVGNSGYVNGRRRGTSGPCRVSRSSEARRARRGTACRTPRR